jgi:Uma2 family endonuclease
VTAGEATSLRARSTEPPLLVVEIRSPSTALIDLNRKKAAHERFGVPSYWIG